MGENWFKAKIGNHVVEGPYKIDLVIKMFVEALYLRERGRPGPEVWASVMKYCDELEAEHPNMRRDPKGI